MPRDPDEGSALVFDLVERDEPGPGGTPAAPGPDGTGDLVRLQGCGVTAAVTPDGLLLDPEPEPGEGQVESLALGGYAWLDQSGPARTVVYGDDGAVVVDVSSSVRGPSAAGGAGPDTLLGTDDVGGRLLAYAADGVPRWDVAAEAPEHSFLAQVGRTAVVTAHGDVATGVIDESAPAPTLVAVDGHMLEVSRTGVRGLG